MLLLAAHTSERAQVSFKDIRVAVLLNICSDLRNDVFSMCCVWKQGVCLTYFWLNWILSQQQVREQLVILLLVLLLFTVIDASASVTTVTHTRIHVVIFTLDKSAA